MDRRTFLSLSAAGAVAPVLAHSAVRPELSQAIVINALGGIENPNIAIERGTRTPAGVGSRERRSDLDARALREAHESGLTAVNLTLGYISGDQEPFEQTVRDIATCDATVRQHSKDLTKILTAQDIVAAKRAGKIGIIYGFQNSAMMGTDASRVEVFANLGVRIIQLTYNPRNQVGCGSMAAENLGLTEFGREVVAQLNTARVLVDLSHSGEQTCLDAIKASRTPVAITHTGCRALADLPRNKTDAELRLLADRGGVVGIYFMPFLKVGAQPTAEDVVRHIEHALNVCGEDHVGFGTDGSVTQIDDLNRYSAALREEVEARRKAGIGATGERPDTYPFIPDLRGVGQFRRLADLLSARGHTSARIEKILGRNFLRLMTDVWPA